MTEKDLETIPKKVGDENSRNEIGGTLAIKPLREMLSSLFDEYGHPNISIVKKYFNAKDVWSYGVDSMYVKGNDLILPKINSGLEGVEGVTGTRLYRAGLVYVEGNLTNLTNLAKIYPRLEGTSVVQGVWFNRNGQVSSIKARLSPITKFSPKLHR